MNLTGTAAFGEEKEMRAVWMATVSNIDFPVAGSTANEQKKEFSDKLDALQAIGINAVMVQVRPKSDALYRSRINPWSDVLTGVQGENPGYDPLEYMVEEAHNRGIELHAWLNPYRITTSGQTDLELLCEGHPAKVHPDWIIEHNGALYYNPAKEEVKRYISDTVGEIVENYNVDGIHFDDYFYPAYYPLPAGEDKDGKEANARRQHVNDMVEMVYHRIKSINKNVQFGISPNGIYKNEETGVYGSVIRGYQSYYEVYADSKAWIDKGIIDYIAPQIYWESNHATAAYESVVRYWLDMVKGTNVKLYIGEAAYKDNTAAEMKSHIDFCRKTNVVAGSIFYNVTNLLANRKGVKDTIKSIYAPGAGTPAGKPVVNPVTPSPSSYEKAYPNSSKIYVNSNKVAIEAYTINDYNYFKLRDIAVLMIGTKAKFSVFWDENANTIIVLRDADYTIVGNELSVGAKAQKTAVKSTAKLMVDKDYPQISAYNIDGNNYYKLRDLASALGFKVDWNEKDWAVSIITE